MTTDLYRKRARQEALSEGVMLMAGLLRIEICRFSSNQTGFLNFPFGRVAANISSKRLECMRAVISSSARDNGHKEGFSHTVCGHE
jgi:hypothetical protein